MNQPVGETPKMDSSLLNSDKRPEDVPEAGIVSTSSGTRLRPIGLVSCY